MGYYEDIPKGNSQKEEIQTIKARNIQLNLSEADCKRITEKAFSCGLTVSDLLESFIGDLVTGTYSNGSDERMYANQWFDRCGFSWGSDNTFIQYLINCGFIDSFIETMEDIERQQEYINLITASGADEAELKEELEELKELKTNLTEAYTEYAESTNNAEDQETALNGVIKYRDQLLSLLGEEVEEPKNPPFRPRSTNTADIEEVLNTKKEYFTPEEAARLLNVHYNTIRRMIKRGDLHAQKYGRQWRIYKMDLLNLNR